MSISVTKIVNLRQAALKFLVQDEIEDEPLREYKTNGGLLADTDYAWLSSGPRLEIVHTKTGSKVGAWTFGWVLKDLNTKVVCVDAIQRPNGRLPLLAVGIDCDFSGGIICIFDFVTSKIIRAIQIKDKITNLHVIDAGYDVFTLPGPLRNFDGVIALGTAGGEVFLVDICRQICDEALTTGGLNEIRDELNPCQLSIITLKDVAKTEYHKELAVRNSEHLAIHLNYVFNKSTRHFTLKGPKGDERVHVNRDEVTVSSLYYCPQLGSLLVGYNFGALQLYNLMNLELVYTSPVCDEHIPISHFAIQEPPDDPRPVCYVWAVYSANEEYPSCLPLAAMYAFCYHSKEYHEGYGFLYQDFSSAAIHYQMELGVPEGHKKMAKSRGGTCLKLNSINKGPANRDGPHPESNEDNLTLCVFAWNVWLNKNDTDTFLAIFDLNQWYKEQMPSVLNAKYCSTYLMHIYLNELINTATNKSGPIFDVYTDKNSLQQFTGAQRLEEHFYPNSLSFGMSCLRESDVIYLHNYGVQKALLAQIESSGPLSLVEPAEIYQEIIGLGLVPLYIDLPVNTPLSTNIQREMILGVALENQLMGWLCKCASEWANGSFLSTGCSLDLLISWAFQRAIALKTNCDKFCVPLFDYSEVRLDNNTNILLNSCTRQLKNLHSLYAFVIIKLSPYISNIELVKEQFKSLETVSVYFEVLQWLLNVGLLPECPLTAYPRIDDLERICAPYPAEMLTDFYNHRRALLKIMNEEQFGCKKSVLFIDSLIEHECGGKMLQEQWRNDGGNGLYPPPSLQALLRTYLVDNVELSYKHSVIIYVFLDLAMTLDQDKYKPVITHLIKFPAVFKVSPSVIKITQAFWQLDHSDYNSAIGLLLDPLILSEDLNYWHHKIVLRALMLQKQHNFALLYIQVRKPVLRDDDDVLTAISLYVANNMLDEAFYFEKHFTGDTRNNKFLSHFFNECRKNDKLRALIYRALNSNDEDFFLKYLTNSKQSTAEDLHVYYHILRSHFMEAFESHERTITNHIENQGLIGQEHAIPRDKLVYSLKKLLPDVNRNLLSLCHKEKNIAWQEVSRPTPMSVFVTNLTENVQYKSTLIGAALAKAKQTFNDIVGDKFKLETEGTPFLRTPVVKVGSRRSLTVIVNPKVFEDPKDVSDIGTPPSAKRLKLSPRLNSSVSTSIPSKLDTPLVKRKTPKTRESIDKNVATPHSILKVKSLNNHTPNASDGRFKDDFAEFEKLDYTPVCSMPKKSGLGLSPRKALTKPSPVVRFEGFANSSSSRNTTSNTSSQINLSPDKRLSGSSKNTSTEDEVFYSPETSLEEKQMEKSVPEINQVSDNEEKEDKQQDFEEKEEKQSPLYSPRGRRSYKRSLGQMTPVRSSPRLSRNSSFNEETPKNSTRMSKELSISSKELSEDSELKEKESVSLSEKTEATSVSDSPKSLSVLPKLRPRKSLCRKVLETNAISRVLSSPLESPRSRRSTKKFTPETVTKIETTEKIVLESSVKYGDGEEKSRSSLIKKHNLTTSIIETDLDTSEDYSFHYDDVEELKLSDSMERYLNSSNKSLKNNSVAVETPTKSSLEKRANEEEGKKGNRKTPTKRSFEDRINEGSKVNDEEASKETEETDGDSTKNGSVADVTRNRDANKSLASSVLESSVEIYQNFSYEENGPKLSDSMVRYIDGRDVSSQDVDVEKTQPEEEVMEVDDDELLTTEENKEEAVVQAKKSDHLNNSELQNEEKEESQASQEESEETDNRPVDPEMNVFEISDDLSFNDGILIEKEVTLEENDLCYGQQNTLEKVIEENMRTVSSSPTPLNVLEKIFFNESSCSGEESNDGENQEQADLEPDEDKENVENEVIEIGSSSEEEQNREESNSTNSSAGYQESEDENLEVLYEKNIYDSEESYSSESNNERHYSEISENSDDEKKGQSGEGFGLFEGDIVVDYEVKEQEEKEIETKPETAEDEERLPGEEETVMETLAAVDSLIENSEDKRLDEKNEDVSVEMEELTYSVQEDSALKTEERDCQPGKTLINKDNSKNIVGTGESATIVEDNKVQVDDNEKRNLEEDIGENLVDKEVEHSEALIKDKKEETLVRNTQGQDTEIEKDEETKQSVIERDILDDSNLFSFKSEPAAVEVCVIEKSEEDRSTKKTRKRSASVSSSASTKSVTRKPRKTTLKKSDSKSESDAVKESLAQPARTLRSRRVSTEENPSPRPVVALRKRSASVDEAKPSKKESKATKKEESEEIEIERKKRGRRASSVATLPKIPEEVDSVNQVKEKRSKSVLEGYSMTRRVTRQQMSLLQKTIGETDLVKDDLELMDPIVLLDKVPFEGKPDPEEQKVYETSPSTTNSASSSPVKASRRLRSASLNSETSERSRSETPVRKVKGRPRKKSTDEESNQSKQSTSSKKKRAVVAEEMEESDKVEPRMTRRRAKSVSSVSSGNSTASESVNVGKRKQRVASQSMLPEIKEEPDVAEKAIIPKKRTRKNSAQT